CKILGVQEASIDVTPEGQTAPPGYGIQIHGCGSTQPSHSIDLIQQAGFNWVKQQVRWDEIEGVRATYSWRCVDDVVQVAQRYGLNVVLSINTAPKWAQNSDGSPNSTRFATFAAAVAQRYKGRIQAVEVLNEPNLFIEWNARLNPAGYAQLLAAASIRIRQIDPNILIISAGLAPTRWNDWGAALDDLKFIQQIAATVSRSADCVGVHYNDGRSSPLDSGSPFEQLVTQYHDLTGKPVCLTEFGIAAPLEGQKPPAGFEWSANTTEADAARWLAGGVRWAQLHPDVIRLIVVWNFDYYHNTDDANSLYALEVDGKLRPAYYALQRALGR
ncbi:MAG TPA: cellulase family glycosylhydrolase, partial [Anaerolineae bacterium]